MIRPFLKSNPIIHPTCFVAEQSVIVGDVVIGTESSVWYHATIRGDVNRIRIGSRTNVQDNVVIHVTNGTAPTHVGNNVTIGHSAVVHGCTIDNDVLIGMGAIIMDGCNIGANSIIGAGALLTMNTDVPERSLVLGSPARVVRTIEDAEIETIAEHAEHYVRYRAIYMGLERPGTNPFYV